MRFLQASLLLLALLLGGSTASAVGVNGPVCGTDPATGNRTECPDYPATPVEDAKPVVDQPTVSRPNVPVGGSVSSQPDQPASNDQPAIATPAPTPEPEFFLVATEGADGFWSYLWVTLTDQIKKLLP